jgi:hypothetical protein
VDENALAHGLSASTRASLSDAVSSAIEALGSDAASTIDADAAARAAAKAPAVIFWPKPTRSLPAGVSIDSMALTAVLPPITHQSSAIRPPSPASTTSADSPFKSIFDVFNEQASLRDTAG